MNIDEMPAGIELDILVAEALGYVRTPITIEEEGIATEIEGPVFIVVKGVSTPGDDRVYVRQDTGGKFTRFAPSTDIAAVWEVTQVLNRRGYTLRLTGPEIPDTTGYLIEKRWSAAFVEPQYAFTNVGQGQGKGSTPSLAICRAALRIMADEELLGTRVLTTALRRLREG